MTIKPVSVSEILAHPELFREYAAECSISEIGEVNPQPQMYAAMENTGNMHSFGLFTGEELAGFVTVFTYVLPHYGKKIATVESIYLSHKNRLGRNGFALMKAAEDCAKENGCEAILYSARAGTSFERLLRMMNTYQHTNSVFLRSLD